ncbi:MAG: methyl-accepting chemotaxis protein, partial [Fimbriimonadales bacterium]|nr:methyl-accepting chemotaxis protein [Fimbriimonadales bacterium]
MQNHANRLKITSWILYGSVAAVVLFMLTTFATLNTVKVNGPLYQQIVNDKDLTADILPPPAYLVETRLKVYQLYRALREKQPPKQIREIASEIEKLAKDYEERHRYWRETLPQGAIRQVFLKDSYEPGKQFLARVQEQLIPAALQGDESAFERAFQQAEQHFSDHRAAIDQTVSLATKSVQEHESHAAATIRTRLLVLSLLGLFVLGVLGYMAFGVMRGLLGNIAQLQTAIGKLAAGNLGIEIPTASRDALHTVILQFNQAVAALRESMQRIQQTNQESMNAVRTVGSGLQEVDRQAAQVNESVRQVTQGMNALAQQVERNSGAVFELRQASDEMNRSAQQAAELIRTSVQQIQEVTR